MKLVIASFVALTAAGISVPALTLEEKTRQAQQGPGNADKLYDLAKQARADLREMRIAAGLHAHPAGPHIDPEGHHANDSPAQRARERGEQSGHEEGNHEGAGGDRGHEGRGSRGERGPEGRREGRGERGHEGRREGRGEHGRREGREGHEGRERGEHGGRREGRARGEEGKTRIAKGKKHVRTYQNGARLTLEFNPNTEAFVGHVQNVTKKALSQVRVEIHLSNGRELGPTKRTDLAPGASVPVELSALDQKFTHWVTHPEAGVEEGHGPGGEESEGHAAREKGEHGAGGGDEGSGEHDGEGMAGKDNRPASRFRPAHNQLLLLRGEMRAFKRDLAAKKASK